MSGIVSRPRSQSADHTESEIRVPLYFAYGANMDRTAMSERCPHSRPLGRGRLRGYRFFISKDGHGSLRLDPEAVVHGLTWRLADCDIGALDRYEDVEAGLYTNHTVTVCCGERMRKALVYVGRGEKPGIAVPGYMEAVVAAGEICRLPSPYLEELRRWLPSTPP